jgi:hypothetical protein
LGSTPVELAIVARSLNFGLQTASHPLVADPRIEIDVYFILEDINFVRG